MLLFYPISRRRHLTMLVRALRFRFDRRPQAAKPVILRSCRDGEPVRAIPMMLYVSRASPAGFGACRSFYGASRMGCRRRVHLDTGPIRPTLGVAVYRNGGA